MPLFLIVLFIVVPIAELYVIIQVGEAIADGINESLAELEQAAGAAAKSAA